ncbi:MAG TPA: class I SAM-dependent methyltransferase [Spirochaetia bacterium]|nr:class I SAM-dependent methyltransferase [Spirochaetia bacterium]
MIHDDQSLLQALHDQFAANRGVNLLNDELGEYVSVSPSFLDAVERLRSRELTSPLDERALSQAAARECIVRLLRVNPYLEIADSDAAGLAAIYESSYAMISSGKPAVEVIGRHHFPALREWVAALYPPGLRAALRDSATVGSLAYSQYSAELQLRMLHIDADSIEGRVLDVGCGPDGRLVHYLRDHGHDAHGIDRGVTHSIPNLEAANWFDFTFRPRTYGLIVSHLAFSSHYLYHASAASEYVQRYQSAYHSIVDALAAGGRFCYVPSLPDVESSLSSEAFTISRWAASPDVSVSAVTRNLR